MDVMSSPKTSSQILSSLRKIAPDVTFSEGDSFFWSAHTNIITYDKHTLLSPAGVWSIIHEVAHALLEHKSYDGDFSLLTIERDAWTKAEAIALELGVTIDPDYIQDCLDSYRDWIHKRSLCPTCSTTSVQRASSTYRCYNCESTWRVSSSRFCRSYRTTVNK